MSVQHSEKLANKRQLLHHISGIETSDGDGVKLTRVIGTQQLDMLDPFLLLDCFESDDASDYIGGFPEHPHRGFETVTYLLNGRMRHKDSKGHEGVIEPGGVQWMSAGKGILHSEMPEQEQGLLKGFQLWVNLPATAKMGEPAYQEFSPELMPVEALADGGEVRVIAGKTDAGTLGPVKNAHTEPTYLDIQLPANGQFKQNLPNDHNAFVYVIDGSISIAESDENEIGEQQLGILSTGEKVSVLSGAKGARLLLIAGRPLNEPVARGGPFVMNTKAEIMQAFNDYSQGKFS